MTFLFKIILCRLYFSQCIESGSRLHAVDIQPQVAGLTDEGIHRQELEDTGFDKRTALRAFHAYLLLAVILLCRNIIAHRCFLLPYHCLHLLLAGCWP